MSKLYIGREFEQAAGDGEGQGSLACCRSWDHKELDTTETEQQLQWDKNSSEICLEDEGDTPTLACNG